mmetsp:Transcript_20796/g.58109  ORF Transcript_20796/g.58109 Transcript_20796/m.58109 type:complete len:250 (-) Transcript_20796:2418-3167(-)
MSSAPSANATSNSSRCISLTADAVCPCMRLPTAFTRQPLHRLRRRSESSALASSGPRPKASRLEAKASNFCSMVNSVLSSEAPTSTRKRFLSCGRVSSMSFSSVKSHIPMSSRSLCTSSGVTLGWFNSLKTLACSMPLLAVLTISFVKSLSMLKNVGTQSVRVEMSVLESSPCSWSFCLMNILHQRDTILWKTFFCWSALRPRIPPKCGFARSHFSRQVASWQVTAFHAKIPYISSFCLSSKYLPTVTG